MVFWEQCNGVGNFSDLNNIQESYCPKKLIGSVLACCCLTVYHIEMYKYTYFLNFKSIKYFCYFTDEKPDVAYCDIGGMDIQKQEVREAVELPLTHFDLYKQIGIDPPRGVLMYGPPGCGKTMLAKAVAHHTTGK